MYTQNTKQIGCTIFHNCLFIILHYNVFVEVLSYNVSYDYITHQINIVNKFISETITAITSLCNFAIFMTVALSFRPLPQTETVIIILIKYHVFKLFFDKKKQIEFDLHFL